MEIVNCFPVYQKQTIEILKYTATILTFILVSPQIEYLAINLKKYVQDL